jgi:hypothetical protein
MLALFLLMSIGYFLEISRASSLVVDFSDSSDFTVVIRRPCVYIGEWFR